MLTTIGLPAALQRSIAYDLDRLFRTVWYKQTGRWFESAGDPASIAGLSNVKIAANSEILRRFVIREGYLYALRAAKEEVCIANAYFIPGWRIRRALIHAVMRGVRVRVMVPGSLDTTPVFHAMRSTYDSLLSRGIEIYEWQGPMLHAKAVLVDRRWCSIGTFNLDHRSLAHNLEVNLNILDDTFAQDLSVRFERGLEGSKQITLADWRKRRWSQKLLEKFWASFDYFF
jgi:cardiolipin synthase